MDGLFVFLKSVLAQVASYYLCTWLDGQIGKGSKH